MATGASISVILTLCCLLAMITLQAYSLPTNTMDPASTNVSNGENGTRNNSQGAEGRPSSVYENTLPAPVTTTTCDRNAGCFIDPNEKCKCSPWGDYSDEY